MLKRDDTMSEQAENRLPILEAAIFAADEPLSPEKLTQLFPYKGRPSKQDIKQDLEAIAELYEQRGVELVQVASGYRFQAKAEFAPWMQRLWEKKPPRYSRALLETLSLVVYQQPITRGEIEEVRGVAVGTHIMKTLLERNWVKIIGHKEVPGKPALFATTSAFLDYFNLKSISELPPLDELIDLEELEQKLGMQLSLGIDESSESNTEAVSQDELNEQVDSEKFEESTQSETEHNEQIENESIEQSEVITEDEDELHETSELEIVDEEKMTVA